MILHWLFCTQKPIISSHLWWCILEGSVRMWMKSNLFHEIHWGPNSFLAPLGMPMWVWPSNVQNQCLEFSLFKFPHDFKAYTENLPNMEVVDVCKSTNSWPKVMLSSNSSLRTLLVIFSICIRLVNWWKILHQPSTISEFDTSICDNYNMANKRGWLILCRKTVKIVALLCAKKLMVAGEWLVVVVLRNA